MVKVLFLQNHVYESQGIMWLSAALKKAGHSTDVLIKNVDKDIVISSTKSNADIIAFSTTDTHKWVLSVAKEIKKKSNKLIIVGGQHATFFPEIINSPFIDIVGMGECEEAMVELANKLDLREDITKIKNLIIKKDGKIYSNELRPLIENLSSLGSPDREIYYNKYSYLRNFTLKGFFTGRGCPYNCTFCFNHSFKKLYTGKGKYVRKRYTWEVINEIKEMKRKYPLKTILFIDDTFIIDKRWVAKFIEMYKREIRLPFICQIRADLADEKIIRILKYGGCKMVFFGLESGNTYLRTSILKKGITNDQIINTARILRKEGIKFRTYNMLGLPGETMVNAWETVHLNQKIRPNFPCCAIMQPHPKTEIYQTCVDMKLISSSCSPDEIRQSFYFGKAISKDAQQMENLQKLFIYAVKFPSFEPLIKKLIKLKPNFLFNMVFIAAMYMQSESSDIFQKATFEYARNIIKSLVSGFRNL